MADKRMYMSSNPRWLTSKWKAKFGRKDRSISGHDSGTIVLRSNY